MPLKIEHILKRIEDLPSLPNSAMQVYLMTNNPETTVQDLHFTLSQDPSLVAGILRQANSAYYGHARRISSLTDAIIILGFQAIHNLAMAAAVSPI